MRFYEHTSDDAMIVAHCEIGLYLNLLFFYGSAAGSSLHSPQSRVLSVLIAMADPLVNRAEEVSDVSIIADRHVVTNHAHVCLATSGRQEARRPILGGGRS